VSLEQGPLSLVSITEELLGRKSRGSVLENREYESRGSLYFFQEMPYSCKTKDIISSQ
jgi:hypothetical protein